MRRTANPAAWPSHTVFVLIDENALKVAGEKFGWRWPWPRTAHAALVAYLKKAGAQTVLFDILFPNESEDTLHDDRFAAHLQAAGNVCLATKFQNQSPLGPISVLSKAAGRRIGWTNTEKDPDGVIRRYPLKNFRGDSALPPLAFVAPQTKEKIQTPSAGWTLLRWQAGMNSLIQREQAVSAALPLLEGLKIVDSLSKTKDADELDPGQIKTLLDRWPDVPEAVRFRGKTVWIGCSAQATFDAVATPLEPHTPGVLVHATARINAHDGQFLRPAPLPIRWLLILAACLSVTLGCLRFAKIRWQILLLVILLAGVSGLSFFLFCRNIWLPPLTAIAGGILSFTGVVTHRYFTEGKQKRWIKQLFSDFVSPQVLEEMLRHPDGIPLLGERRIGTVLFCDLQGFTTFSEKAPPKQFFDAINTYLADASKILLAHGAYIDKFMGDAVMAVFNIPQSQSDHATKACLAALDLQEMIRGLNVRLGQQYQVTLGLRVGVNTGEMISGPVGFARKLNYTVLGDPVNLGSRLEGANKAYHTRIMIGPDTHAQACGAIETRPLDLLQVKGKIQPVQVHELMAPKGKLSPEQSLLRDAYLEGLARYRQQQWPAASENFKRALSIDPQDGPSRVYLDRCAHYAANPPPPGWDGSFALDHK